MILPKSRRNAGSAGPLRMWGSTSMRFEFDGLCLKGCFATELVSLTLLRRYSVRSGKHGQRILETGNGRLCTPGWWAVSAPTSSMALLSHSEIRIQSSLKAMSVRGLFRTFHSSPSFQLTNTRTCMSHMSDAHEMFVASLQFPVCAINMRDVPNRCDRSIHDS